MSLQRRTPLKRNPVGRKKVNATTKADVAFSRIVRGSLDGKCWAYGHRFGCEGYIQCCHIISRRYRAIRWAAENAVPMCSAHHVYFTHHPLEWEDYIGPVTWAELRHRALNDPPEKAADALKRLQLIG
jgi:hypothetical protein